METESTFVRHEPCPSCGSRDNLGRFSDGHGYCFGCHYRESGDSDGDRFYQQQNEVKFWI